MNKVRILKVCKGSNDGINVLTYTPGNIEYISDSLLKAFLADGYVELFEKPKEEPKNPVEYETKVKEAQEKKIVKPKEEKQEETEQPNKKTKKLSLKDALSAKKSEDV